MAVIPFSNIAVSLSTLPFWGSPVIEAQDGTLTCPGFTGNTYAINDPYSLVTVGGSTMLPGVAEVVISEKERSLDKKKPVGTDGARLTLHGLNPAMVTINLTIWTPEQLRQLQNVWKIIFTPLMGKALLAKAVSDAFNAAGSVTGGVDAARQAIKIVKATGAEAFAINHPVCAFHGVPAVIFIGGTGPAPAATSRARLFTIKAIEFSQPIGNATTTPKAAVSSTPNLLDPNANSYPTPGADPLNTGP